MTRNSWSSVFLSPFIARCKHLFIPTEIIYLHLDMLATARRLSPIVWVGELDYVWVSVHLCVRWWDITSCKQKNSNRVVMHREDEEAKEVYRKRHEQQEGRGKRQKMQITLWRGAHKGRTSSRFSHLEPDLEGCPHIADTDPAVLGPGGKLHTF